MVAATLVKNNGLRCQNGVMVSDFFAFMKTKSCRKHVPFVTESWGANINDQKNIQPNICRWQLKLEAGFIFSSGRVAVGENATSSISIWLVKQEDFCVTRHLMSGGMRSSIWRTLNFFCWKLLKFTLAEETRSFVSENKSISQVNKYYLRANLNIM